LSTSCPASCSAPLAEQIFREQGLRLITNLRKNLRNIRLPFADKLLLRKRALLRPSSINSRMSARLSIHVTATRSTSACICSLASLRLDLRPLIAA
jgi:hypothetical protein